MFTLSMPIGHNLSATCNTHGWSVRHLLFGWFTVHFIEMTVNKLSAGVKHTTQQTVSAQEERTRFDEMLSATMNIAPIDWQTQGWVCIIYWFFNSDLKLQKINSWVMQVYGEKILTQLSNYL